MKIVVGSGSVRSFSEAECFGIPGMAGDGWIFPMWFHGSISILQNILIQLRSRYGHGLLH